jgi:hypothetical protein
MLYIFAQRMGCQTSKGFQKMASRCGAPLIVFVVVAFSLHAGAQTASRNNSEATPAKLKTTAKKEQQATPPNGPALLDGWGRPVTDALKPGEKPGAAPRHDISGTWEPARGPGDGIQANGPRDMPYDGKP